MYRSSWCEIDLAQFRVNVATLRKLAGRAKTLLVVKANAYGHGLVPIASEAARIGVDMLGVASIGEAAELIEHGVKTPILMMCALDDEEVSYCVAHGVAFMASRLEQIQLAHAVAQKHRTTPRIHLELDIGMSRSGVDVEDLPTLLNNLPSALRRNIVGMCGHFSSADLEDLALTERQLHTFLSCCERVRVAGLDPLFHVANSPATIRLERGRLGMVRLGIAAYGLPPSDCVALPPGLAAILSWKAKVTNLKDIAPGRAVGYGATYVARENERLATLPIGYADGFRRVPKGVNTVLLNGAEHRVVGSVFMDQCVVRLENDGRYQLGDVAVLLGQQRARELSAEQLADRWTTNNYDVVAGIRRRVPRIYLGGVPSAVRP